MSKLLVKVKQGTLKGVERTTAKGNKFCSFKGIPYAEPPVGHLRFKDPLPATSWSTIRDASKEGNKAPQVNMMSNGEVCGNEDCLYLNIYTPTLPKNTSHKPHPVMVHIHGGGFRMGSGDEAEYGPEFFIDKDTILVTINYRLGVFGFLCLDTPEVPGNAGLKDQSMALRWVKENIKHFNGDHNNITIFGVSAGSASVEYQLISPLSKNCFHKAIMQSGSVLSSWSRNRKPEVLLRILLNQLNIPSDDPTTLLEQLQMIDMTDLLKALLFIKDEELIKEGSLFGFSPVIEKSFDDVEGFLTADPLELLRSGQFSKVPTITGFCKNEGSMFKFFYGDSRIEQMENNERAYYMAAYSIQDETKANEELTSIYKSNGVKNADDFLSDLMFVAGINKSLRYRMRHVKQNYGYMFSYTGGLKMDFSIMGIEGKQAHHGADILYLTKMVGVNEDTAKPRDHVIRERMIEMWTSFAKSGIPIAQRSEIPVNWTPITERDFRVLEINYKFKMIPFPWADRMKVWDNFFNDNES